MKLILSLLILCAAIGVTPRAEASLVNRGIQVHIVLNTDGTKSAMWTQTCGSTDDATIQLMKTGSFVVDGSLLAGTLAAALTAKVAEVKAATGCQ